MTLVSASSHRVIEAASLGSAVFCKEYGVRYAYTAGAMYKGIASKELVIAMGKAGLLSFLGTGGLDLQTIGRSIQEIRSGLSDGQPFGMNLLHNPRRPELEEAIVDLYLRSGVRVVEAAAYMTITSGLVRFRLTGARRNGIGDIETPNRIICKVSRPEVATAFMQPAPEVIVKQLLDNGQLTISEAELAASIPVAGDVCVEADSGGHTDQRVAYALMPAMLSLRDKMMLQYRYQRKIQVGAAGGIGTPAAAAAAFVMGADFVTTGSVNQCTVEAGTSDAVKEMLQEMNVQDTAIAPAGDMFELGAKVQVLKKGLLFPARANKLYEVYLRYDSLEAIDAKTRTQIQEKFFGKSFEDVWAETKTYHSRRNAREVEEAEKEPKKKMALLFKWYFAYSTRLAMEGSETQKVDYQVHCGPALGAFNQWVKGTQLAPWENRYVADIAARIMHGAAETLENRLLTLTSQPDATDR